ncbi:class I SAM-dependent methyltransferase [Rarobacter faecitabidus]|uniref:Methyltransferase family protein n=1 Tax=Rarobacter faecitabidus TaxID=13243 RepID=A0A542ZTE7_RARFA|nr:methyltransferase domain-containing protein [Rarobacter faecitabidus]TQL63635.1 methyltransferase family protein [Rarobacter faecitabidus]
MTTHQPKRPATRGHGGSSHRSADESQTSSDPTQFWQDRYGQSDRIWSGKPNAIVEEIASRLPAGRALDLGCGEGGDAVWLATRGWQVAGVDISEIAIGRARAAALEAGVAARTQFIAADLTTFEFGRPFDLVMSSFFHSPVALERTEILRRSAETVAPGGHFLLLTHAAFPPWATSPDRETHRLLSPAEDLAALDLAPDSWHVDVAETRPRMATGPDGSEAEIDDGVLLLTRR